jgi:hypothetical protein
MSDDTTAPVTAEGLRERIAGALRAAYNAHGTTDRLPQMVSFGTLADAALAALAGDPGDLPARMAEAIVAADAEWTTSREVEWKDHLATAAMSVRWEHAASQAAEVERLRAELTEAREELGQLRLDDEIEQRATALSPADFEEDPY